MRFAGVPRSIAKECLNVVVGTGGGTAVLCSLPLLHWAWAQAVLASAIGLAAAGPLLLGFVCTCWFGINAYSALLQIQL